VRPTLAHKTQEAIIRVPSNTPPPPLLVPMSRSPTPHPAGSGCTIAAYTYNQFSEFLRPAIHVLKRYYRQSRSGGVAHPIAVGLRTNCGRSTTCRMHPDLLTFHWQEERDIVMRALATVAQASSSLVHPSESSHTVAKSRRVGQFCPLCCTCMETPHRSCAQCLPLRWTVFMWKG